MWAISTAVSEATDDMELLRQPVPGWSGLGEHLLEGIPVRAIFLRQSCIPAEDAGLPQDADVRRVDVLIRREGHDAAVLRAVHCVRQRAHAQEVGRLIERQAVRIIQPLAGRELLGNGS